LNRVPKYGEQNRKNAEEFFLDKYAKSKLTPSNIPPLVILPPSNLSIKPELTQHVCPRIYCWAPVEQFNVMLCCKNCKSHARNNGTVKISEWTKCKAVFNPNGASVCFYAIYKCSICNTKIFSSSEYAMLDCGLPKYVLFQCPIVFFHNSRWTTEYYRQVIINTCCYCNECHFTHMLFLCWLVTFFHIIF